MKQTFQTNSREHTLTLIESITSNNRRDGSTIVKTTIKGSCQVFDLLSSLIGTNKNWETVKQKLSLLKCLEFQHFKNDRKTGLEEIIEMHKDAFTFHPALFPSVVRFYQCCVVVGK